MPSITLSAHAAFFVESAPTPDLAALLQRGPLLAFVGGVLAALAAWTIASLCADPRRDRCAVRWLSETVSGALMPLVEFVPPIARIALGATLLWCAAIGAVATPNLLMDGASGELLRGASALVGACLVAGILPRASALLAVGVFALATVTAGTPVVLLERLDIVGLGAFVAVLGGRRLEPRLDAAALATVARAGRWLRVCVAVSLLTVAITEKLANVPMTARVLAEHPRMNVGTLLQLDMTTTVLLLGAVEVAFAVLVLVLPLPELLALAIGAPFVLTVGEFGLLEVPGHLPVWGAVAALALLGSHLQTADLLSARPPWLRAVERTPAAARERIVGERVPWRLTAPEPQAALHVAAAAPLRVAVGGSSTLAAARPAVPEATTLPARPTLPQLAPQVAAWLTAAPAPAPTPAPAHMGGEAPARFEWAAAPGTGGPATLQAR